MKLIHIKPQLVDHALLKPKIIPKIPKIIPKIESSTNNISVYINCIGILILIIGLIILYQRLMDKQSIEYEKQNTILTFHQYVKDNLQENLKK
jgi:hypothetical protein